jgi:K+-transporting ATPase ATPase C chain
MLAQLRPAIVSTLAFTLLLGLAYPLAVTGIANLAMPWQSQGSLIRDAKGQLIGSALLGQGFAGAQYLQGRPSAAGANGYDASASSGSNLGPINPALIDREKTGAAAYRASTGQTKVAADAVTTSGSGLDPDVSPENALAQAARIARQRGVSTAVVQTLINEQTQGPALGFLGQPRVNVLKANLALDARFPVRHPAGG